jgi:hypothetical protein
MLVHQRILDALATGLRWGRQTFVAGLAYPVLPTLALMPARLLARLIPGRSGPELLTAVAQAWTAVYLFRTLATWRQRLLAALALAVLAAVEPGARLLSLASPAWVAAPAAAAALFHLRHWRERCELRDLVVTAACAAILVLAGPAAALLGFVVLVGTQRITRRVLPIPEERRGLAVLLWLPFVYAAGLLVLANWLIMGDPVSAFRGTLQAAPSLRGTGFGDLAHPLLVTGLALAAQSAVSPRSGVGAFTLACSVGLLGVIDLAVPLLGVHWPTPAPLLFVVVSMAVVGALDSSGSGRMTPVRAAWPLALGVGLTCFAVRTEQLERQASFLRPAPGAAWLIDRVDRQWPEGRILVYGPHVPALYPDPEERRFLARLDFDRQDFLRQAREEQLHLLVPPGGRGLLSPVPMGGDEHSLEPYLLLEEVDLHGWQLWRCVIPPDTESALGELAGRPEEGHGR